MHPSNAYGSSLICWSYSKQMQLLSPGTPSAIFSIDEVLINIFRNFKFHDTVGLSLVCKTFARICLSHVLWKKWVPGCPPKNTLKEYNQHRGLMVLQQKIQQGVSWAFQNDDIKLSARLFNFLVKLIGDKLEYIETEFLYRNRPAFRIHLQSFLEFNTSEGTLDVPAIFCVEPLGEMLYIYQDPYKFSWAPTNLQFHNKHAISTDTLDMIMLAYDDVESFVLNRSRFIGFSYNGEVKIRLNADRFLESITPKK